MNKAREKKLGILLEGKDNLNVLLEFLNESLNEIKDLSEEQMGDSKVPSEQARYNYMKYLGAKSLINSLRDYKVTLENEKERERQEKDRKEKEEKEKNQDFTSQF